MSFIQLINLLLELLNNSITFVGLTFALCFQHLILLPLLQLQFVLFNHLLRQRLEVMVAMFSLSFKAFNLILKPWNFFFSIFVSVFKLGLELGYTIIVFALNIPLFLIFVHYHLIQLGDLILKVNPFILCLMLQIGYLLILIHYLQILFIFPILKFRC